LTDDFLPDKNVLKLMYICILTHMCPESELAQVTEQRKHSVLHKIIEMCIYFVPYAGLTVLKYYS
jgi:hypothetical protein